jgi:hypothetical protein
MNGRIDSRPRTVGELAAYYCVDVRTFKKWLDCPTLSGVRPEKGRFYSIRQVREIVRHLGGNDEINPA